MKPLTVEDAAAIRKRVGWLLVGVAEVQVTQRIATTPTHNHATMIVGSSPDMRPVRGWTCARAFLRPRGHEEAGRGVLPRPDGAQKLFPDLANPVGQMIRVDRLHLRVIGVLAPKGRTPTGGDQDDQIFVPLPLCSSIGRRGARQHYPDFRAVAGPDDRAKTAIANVLREKHHVKAGTEDFDVSSVQEMAEIAVIMTRTMQLLIALIASISLVVGGIGIMNIMLVSVTERTREIGIRMAVGPGGRHPGAVSD